MAKKLRDIVEAKASKPWYPSPDSKTMNLFIGKHIEQSKITHDGLRKKFKKYFGKEAHDKHFDKLISKHVD